MAVGGRGRRWPWPWVAVAVAMGGRGRGCALLGLSRRVDADRALGPRLLLLFSTLRHVRSG